MLNSAVSGLMSKVADVAERAAEGMDSLRGQQPYAARLARASVKSGYLAGLSASQQWQRRFFVLKPTTMLYYFGSDADEVTSEMPPGVCLTLNFAANSYLLHSSATRLTLLEVAARLGVWDHGVLYRKSPPG